MSCVPSACIMLALCCIMIFYAWLQGATRFFFMGCACDALMRRWWSNTVFPLSWPERFQYPWLQRFTTVSLSVVAVISMRSSLLFALAAQSCFSADMELKDVQHVLVQAGRKEETERAEAAEKFCGEYVLAHYQAIPRLSGWYVGQGLPLWLVCIIAARDALRD